MVAQNALQRSESSVTKVLDVDTEAHRFRLTAAAIKAGVTFPQIDELMTELSAAGESEAGGTEDNE